MANQSLIISPGCQALIQRGPRRGQQCGAATVTTYPYCHQHLREIAQPARNDRYMSKTPQELRQHFEDMLEDPHPRDLIPEIANLRTLVGHVLEQAGVIGENGQLSMSKKDLEYIYAGFKLIGELTERQSKINPEKFVPVPEVMRIITDIIDIVRNNIPADMMPVRERIAAEIQKYCMSKVVDREEGPESNGPHKP